MNANTWIVAPFSKLNTTQLYDALKLRIDVFVVEQTCYYPDLDDLDRHEDTLHVLVYEGKEIVGYLRVLPPGTTYQDRCSIGRVAISHRARGKGLAHKLMKNAHELVFKHFPDHHIKISAQEYLKKFYEQHGYKIVSEVYLEDGIPHVAMEKINNAK